MSYVQEFSEGEINARKFSTLDLCGFDAFTLIAGSRTVWTPRVEALQIATSRWSLLLRLAALGSDFDFVSWEHADLFEAGTKMNKGSGLLVRPDQHLLLLVCRETSVRELEMALRDHLGL